MEFSTKLGDLTAKCFELFRHYWGCFPVNPRTKTKLQRLQNSLSESYSELEALRRECREDNSYLFKLTIPLARSLDQIFELEKKRAAKESERASKRQKLANDSATVRAASPSAVSAS